MARVAAKMIRDFLQAQQFAEQIAQDDGEHGEDKLFEARQNRSVDTQPNEPQAEKNGESAECRTKENLRAEGQRFAQRQTEQRPDQNAHCVEKCAGHTLTQRGMRPKRKPENAQGGAGTPNQPKCGTTEKATACLPARLWPVTQTRMADAKISSRSPWFWVPTLYVAEGLPYALADRAVRRPAA